MILWTKEEATQGRSLTALGQSITPPRKFKHERLAEDRQTSYKNTFLLPYEVPAKAEHISFWAHLSSSRASENLGGYMDRTK